MTSDALMLGRDEELATAESLLRASMTGSPAVVVIAGEAGIGKSTLALAVADRARALGCRVGAGLCLDVSARTPFGPVLEGLRKLDVLDPPHQREALAQTVLDLAASGPTVIVLEDLHWADGDTLDLVRTLGHSAVGSLLLVLTVRSEDAPRGHPAAEVVLDLARSPLTRQLDLGPLDESALRLLAARNGMDLDVRLLRDLQERSDGNPLYAEELLHARAVDASGQLPTFLADLFLARVGRLGEPAATHLRVASVTGTRIDESLTATALEVPPDDLTASLKTARDHRLVVVRMGHLEFRHALLRDALYDDLLPGERTALHRRMAAALDDLAAGTEDDIALLSALAFHTSGAADWAAALVASVRAGRLWRTYGAAGGAEHFARALDIWSKVSDPERLTGLLHADLLRLAGEATADHGRTEEARALLRAAVEEAEAGDDRMLLSRAYTSYSANVARKGDRLSERDLVTLALEAAGPDPSAERAAALVPLGYRHFLAGRLRDAVAAARELVSAAQTLGDRPLEAEGHGLMGLSSMELGRVAEGTDEVRIAIAQFARIGRPGDVIVLQQQLAWEQALSGAAEPARALAMEAAGEARRRGMPGKRQGALEQLAAIETWRGELSEAERIFEEMRGSGLLQQRLPVVLLDLLVARGDLAAAAAEWDATDHDALSSSAVEAPSVFLAAPRIELSIGFGEFRAAARTTTASLAAAEGSDAVADRAIVTGYGWLVLFEHARRGLVPPPDLRTRAVALLQAYDELPAADRTEWQESWPAALLLAARACRAALDDEPQVALWQEAVAVLERTGWALWRLRLQPYLAEALWEAGERASARRLVHDTWFEAQQRGAGAVCDHARQVAVRHRITLPEQRLSPLEARLTPREREVLALLTDGATNRTIAETLFISEKTVSVHVSHVMAKLGASNRGEAVALARRQQ